jgi:hypothetical protein
MPKPPRYYPICCWCGFAGFIVNRPPCTIWAFDHRPLVGDKRAYPTEKKIKKIYIYIYIKCDIRYKKEKVHVGRNTKLLVIVDSYLYVVGRTSSYVAVLR